MRVHVLWFTLFFASFLLAKKIEFSECLSSDVSLTSSTSSLKQSSLSSISTASLDSCQGENTPILEPQYDYFDETFIKSVVDFNSRYVLVATGWSESSLGKMNKKNAEKQKRSFPMSYYLADRINNMGGRARIIYQTTARINKDYRKYLYYLSHRDELQDMSEDEITRRVAQFEESAIRISFLSFKDRDKLDDAPVRYLYKDSNAYRRIKVPKILNRLHRSKFESTTVVGFTAHFSGPHLEEHARSFGLPYLVNPSSQAYRIKKSQSRQSFRDSGVRHPRGTYDPAFSKEDLARDIYNLLMEIDFPKIVLKLDESAGGYGNKVMKFEEFNKAMNEQDAYALIMARLNDIEKFPPPFIERIEEDNGGAIVEEFIVGEDFSSPASVYMITGLHQVSVRYTYDQLLGGVDNQDFKGSLGPIPLLMDPSSNIVLMSEKIGNLLSEQGVRGNVGTDFVIITNARGERLSYAIENNVRNTGTSYPYNALKMLVGEAALKTKFMKAFDDVKIPLITKKAFREKIQELFYRHLRTHPLSFDKKTVRGCLVHHDTVSIGKIGVVCLADSLDEAREMFDDFTQDAIQYLENHELMKAHEKYLLAMKKLNNPEEEWTGKLIHELPRTGSTYRFSMSEDEGIFLEVSEDQGEVQLRRVRFME